MYWVGVDAGWLVCEAVALQHNTQVFAVLRELVCAACRLAVVHWLVCEAVVLQRDTQVFAVLRQLAFAAWRLAVMQQDGGQCVCWQGGQEAYAHGAHVAAVVIEAVAAGTAAVLVVDGAVVAAERCVRTKQNI